jgi:uncharacterized protein YjbI with pentapeptide repeats
MADEKHLAILVQGIEIWNDWRKKNPHIIPNLEKANLRKINLGWGNLVFDSKGNILKGTQARNAIWDDSSKCKICPISANLRDVIFRGADLREANLIDADLSGADLSGADLGDAKLMQSCLGGANLSKANLKGAQFTLAGLGGANLKGVDLSEFDFRDVGISRNTVIGRKWRRVWRIANQRVVRSNFRGVDLSNANLSSANLGGLDFSAANLSNTDFKQANFKEAVISEDTVIEEKWRKVWEIVNQKVVSLDFKGADLSGANLSDTNLSGFDLSDADLSNANLRDANLSNAKLWGTNLCNADLRGANLNNAEFWRTNLKNAKISGNAIIEDKWRQVWEIASGKMKSQNFSGTDFSGAGLSNTNLNGFDLSNVNFQEANLSKVQALGANFSTATFTGACIEDWNINNTTNLDNIICDYIYLKQNQQERRPSSGNFAPGEFTKLFQKALETVDLIFTDGIDWKAFFLSFQGLQAKYGEENLSVQAIEKKSGNAFVIRLEVPPETDKAEVEKETKGLYEAKLQILESQYRAQLQIKDGQIENFQSQIIEYRQNNTKLIDTIQILANRPIQNIIDVKATSESKSMSESKREANFNLQGAQFAGGLVNAETVNANHLGGNITNNPQQSAEINNSATKTILILAANPKNTSNLRLDEEVREIDAGLQRAKKRELFDLKQRWAVRVQDIHQALLDFKPQIVHFSGHGDGSDGLVLEDDTGMLKLIDNYALAQLFQLFSNSIECVVLNACYSEVQAEAIVKYIPYVIGMNKQIGDKAAIKFATGFYSALGAGESVDFAYKLGCNVIQLDGIAEHLTPVIKKK